MYDIAVKQGGKDPHRSTVTDGHALRQAVEDLVRGEGLADWAPAAVAAAAVGAQAMADADGFAALTLGGSWITVRPHRGA